MSVVYWFSALSCLAIAVGCTGSGSDIGPEVAELSESSYRVLVRRTDDADSAPRGVSSATVTIDGITEAGTTRRSGRADLRVDPGGVRRITIDASNASATSGDLLAGYTFAVDTSGEDEVPFVVYVPDLSTSVQTVLNAGVQAGSTHNDDANSGAILTAAAGSVIGFGSSSVSTIRTGRLAVEQLPGRVAPVGSGTRLVSRGILVDPLAFTSSPGAVLSIPNDLNLPASTGAEMFRLDASTGEWTKAADAVTDGAGARIVSAGGVTVSGLYCFVATATAETVLSGRVLDPEGEPIGGVLVRAPQAWAVTDGGGRYTLPATAAVDAQGAPLTVNVVFHGGRDLRPVRVTSAVTLVPGTQDLGDITMDTESVTRLRGLLVNRGRRDPRRVVRVSTVSGLATDQGFANAEGEFEFPDLENGSRVGFLLTRLDPRDRERVLSAEGVFFMTPGVNTFDGRWFFQEQQWMENFGGDPIVFVIDSVGGGRIDDAAIVRTRSDQVDEFVDTIRFGGVIRSDFGDLDGAATASFESSSDGRRVVSAFSIRRAQSNRVELPLERARRQPLGSFERFGYATGTFGAAFAARRVRSTCLLDREVWLDEVFDGQALLDSMPRPIDPAQTGGTTFLVGVPAGIGNLAATAGSNSGLGGSYRIEQVWLRPDLRLGAGTRTGIDLGAGVPAATPFTVSSALQGLDGAIPLATLQFDHAVEFNDGRVIDVARDIAGNHTIDGTNVTFTLPAFEGDLADARQLLGFGGRAEVGDVTRTQRSLVTVDRNSAQAVTLHPVPTITAPQANDPVAASTFTVNFSLPPGSAYGVLRLRQEGANSLNDWTVVVPPEDTVYTFRGLPEPAVTPLATGRFRLSLTAARIESGLLTELDNPYDRIVARWFGLGLAERNVNAISTVEFDVFLQ